MSFSVSLSFMANTYTPLMQHPRQVCSSPCSKLEGTLVRRSDQVFVTNLCLTSFSVSFCSTANT